MKTQTKPTKAGKGQPDPLERHRAVHVPVRMGGGVLEVTALRAALLLRSGEAEPGDWTVAQARAVLDADEARQRVIAERLAGDGLLVTGDPDSGFGIQGRASWPRW